MIKVKCKECGSISYKSPSKVNPRNYCDRSCYAKTRNRELVKFGYKFPKGRPEIPQRLEAMKKLSGENHYAWKGEKVSYRGLHYWIRRKKGKPTKCSKCGFESHRPRMIQWANVDFLYRRRIEDYVALCASCHKLHDRALKSIQDCEPATQ